MAMKMNEFFYGGNEQPRWQEVADYQRPYDYRANFDNRNSGRTLPTYEFMVPMCCAKCVEKVREELSELEGAYEVFADQLSERAAVTGFVDPFQALKKMKRIKKKAEFWDRSSPSLKPSRHKKSSSYTSHSSKSSQSSYKKQHSRHDQTVYRSSPSQFISYNKEPSRVSTSHRNSNYPSYDDGLVSYSSLRPASSHRNSNYPSYDDGPVSYSSLRPASSHRNSNYPSYDDGPVSYSSLRPASSHRNSTYPSYDDGPVSYSNRRPASSHGLSHRQSFGYYDDGAMSYPDHGLSYRKNYDSYDDGVSYSDLSRPSSSLCLPQSRSLRYETVPPFAQDYYTEDYEEDYPLFNRY